MLLYKYRPWNVFAEEILVKNSIFYPSRLNLNDLSELSHPIKLDTEGYEIFKIKSSEKNSVKQVKANVLAYDISQILKKIANDEADNETIEKYSKYLKIKDRYERTVVAAYDQISDMHTAFFYYAVNQYENARYKYCSYSVAANRINSKLESIGILSLSGKADCPVMWAHYAANHTGIIFIFDTERDPLLATFQKINYTEHRMQISLDNIPEVFYSKSIDWAYEQEYRVIVKFGDECRIFNRNALTGIVLGIRMPTEVRNSIINIIKDLKLDITVFQAETSSDNYKIGTKKISI